MENQTDPFEPGSTEGAAPSQNPVSPLLTVSQAYEHLIAEGLPRSKKTIRKWCRLNHVEKKQNVIPGGPKWLITRSSLDSRIAEERLIDASLTQETGSNRSERVPLQTGTNPSAPVRDDELVAVLKQQLVHERGARKAIEEKNRELINMYHEISMASTQLGIEIGKGMQEQGKARQLRGDGDPASYRSHGEEPVTRTLTVPTKEQPPAPSAPIPATRDHGGDNPSPQNGIHPVQ
ncbi:MAG: hypothetical protein ACI9MU_003280 [Alphaproteobacteria bacterium]|jgi:hypothetical protein